MTHSRRAGYSAVGLLLFAACDSACAVDPLGFYMGAGVGRSHVRSDLNFSAFGPPFPGGFSTVGTKGSASIPPTVSTGGLNATVSSHPKAAAVFAMGYLPIPLPALDVFAKAGAARLKSSVNATGQATCPISVPTCFPIFVPPYSASGSSTRFAYGAGLQVKVAGLAVRAEYERISAGGGDPDLLSLALTWGL
jgi:opacity protein-like surface antigen